MVKARSRLETVETGETRRDGTQLETEEQEPDAGQQHDEQQQQHDERLGGTRERQQHHAGIGNEIQAD